MTRAVFLISQKSILYMIQIILFAIYSGTATHWTLERAEILIKTIILALDLSGNGFIIQADK